MNIGIRADGNSAVGFGHILRMAALAKLLTDFGHGVYFFGQVFPSYSLSNIPIIPKPESVVFEEELDWLEQKVAEYDCQILIIDSYNYQEQELNQISSWPVYSVYYDDLNRHPFSVDCVINGNVFGDTLPYKGTSLFLLGKEYALLRSEFTAMPEKDINKVNEVLITAGGADVANATPKLIAWLKESELFNETHFHVAMGPAFQNYELIERETEGLLNIVLHRNANMPVLIKKCDMAVSAAGQTIHELMAGGVPALLIVTADNQRKNAETAADIGFGLNLGNMTELSKKAFLKAFTILYVNHDMRRSMSQKGQKLIDGYGADRLAKRLLQEFASKN